jgi:hypothetical protein
MSNETTNEALRRHGYERASHEPGDVTCEALRLASGAKVGPCFGRHIRRILDGEIVGGLGCSPPVRVANEWIARGCPVEDEPRRSS